MSSMDNSKLSSINSLQQNQKAVMLVLMVLRQGSSIVSKQNSKPIRKLIFVDEQGTLIYGIIFANAIQYFEDQLKPNRTYLISNPTIREINTSFPNVNQKIELVLQTNTTITELERHFKCSGVTFRFLEFADVKINSQDGQPLDVIGAIMKVKQSVQYKRRDKSICYRREVILMNLLHDTITINLWDDLAINEGQWLQEIENEKPIIAFSNMKRHIYQDTIELKSTFTTAIYLNPPCTESDQIDLWLKTSTEEQNLEELWMATRIKDSKEITLKQLINERDTLSENASYYFKGYVNEVENRSNPWYEACNNCSRAITKTNDAPSCRTCIDFLVEAVPRYRLIINAESDEEKVRITLFDDVASAFIGCPIKDYINSISEDVNTSPFYSALEVPDKGQYKFLFKLHKNVETRNGILSIVLEGFEKPLHSFSNSHNSSKITSNHFKENRSARKQGQTTKSRTKKTKEIQKIDDGHGSPHIKVQDDDVIASFAKTKTTKPGHSTKPRSKRNKDIQIIDDGGGSKDIIHIEDDEKLSSFTNRKRSTKNSKEIGKVTLVKIKQEKI